MANKGIPTKHFDIAEMKKIDRMVKKFISIIESKGCRLTEEQKEFYMNIPEEKRRIISKVMHFRNDEPSICSDKIDWNEFYDNYADNLFLTSTILAFQSIIKQLESIQILDNLSNYKAALEDFEYTADHKHENYRLATKYDALKLYK
jgi:hypothetical protein